MLALYSAACFSYGVIFDHFSAQLRFLAKTVLANAGTTISYVDLLLFLGLLHFFISTSHAYIMVRSHPLRGDLIGVGRPAFG
jgi:hypothetical protein